MWSYKIFESICIEKRIFLVLILTYSESLSIVCWSMVTTFFFKLAGILNWEDINVKRNAFQVKLWLRYLHTITNRKGLWWKGKEMKICSLFKKKSWLHHIAKNDQTVSVINFDSGITYKTFYWLHSYSKLFNKWFRV